VKVFYSNAVRSCIGGDVVGVNDTVRFYGSDVSPADEKDLLAKRTYYFGYDGFDVSDEDTLSIYAHAKRLLNGKRAHVRVEGHTDERGSREYNVALGERRANAVANILMLKGVPQDQISVVSYGKEKPAVAGHSESSWSQNRRVVIIYEVE
jgi:peptidoglycan-associated lipoprotein